MTPSEIKDLIPDDMPMFIIEELVTRNLFESDITRYVGCLIHDQTISRIGIVRMLLPVVDEATCTYRLLCEEDLGDARKGRCGGWFVTSPSQIEIINTFPADGSINTNERVKICDAQYRRSLS